jgi:hypothetical protein
LKLQKNTGGGLAEIQKKEPMKTPRRGGGSVQAGGRTVKSSLVHTFANRVIPASWRFKSLYHAGETNRRLKINTAFKAHVGHQTIRLLSVIPGEWD